MMENFISCKNCGLKVFEKETVWVYTHNSNLKELGYTCPSCQRKQAKEEREAKKEMVKNLKLTELLKKRVILAHFLEMLDFYEFELYVDEQTNQFALSDNQHANLGDIEEDRFDTLLDVIDRMEVYHNDYIYESYEACIYEGEESSFWDLICVDFLESEVISEIAKTIVPNFFEQHKTENIENLTELVETILNQQSERTLRDAIRESALKKLIEYETKGIKVMKETSSILFNHIVLDMLIEDDLKTFSTKIKKIENFNMEWFLIMKEKIYEEIYSFIKQPIFFTDLSKDAFYQILQKFCNESIVYNN